MVVRRIVAASSGFGSNRRHDWTVGPLVQAALDLSAHPHAPRLAYLGTAMGDRVEDVAMVHGAFTGTEVTVSTVRLMPQPNVPDLREALLSQDVIYVGGGSVAGLLALWRLHGLDRDPARGVGSRHRADRCFSRVDLLAPGWANRLLRPGPPGDHRRARLPALRQRCALRLRTDRRPVLHAAVADGTLPTSYATDNGVALLYEDTRLVDVISDREGAAAYRVERRGEHVEETRLPARVLT